MVGVIGFEPTAPSSQNWCANQAALHPEALIRNKFYRGLDFNTRHLKEKIATHTNY